MPPTKKDEQDAPKVAGNWSEWANYVLIELKRLNGSMQNLETQIVEIKLELVQLKVKSSLWGAAAGALTFISFLGVNYLKSTIEQKSTLPTPPAYYQYYPNPSGTSSGPVSPSAPGAVATPAPAPTATSTNPQPIGKTP